MNGLPFRHVLNVRTLPKKGRDEMHQPSAEERAAIAAHVGVESIASLKLTAAVLPWKRDGIRVEGHVTAQLTQACVVSLDPVEATIDEPFEALLVPENSRLAARDLVSAEMVLDAGGEDPPETFSGDTIDLAEIWMEFLALAIDPFPRAPNAELAADNLDEKPSPFAALAALKANDG